MTVTTLTSELAIVGIVTAVAGNTVTGRFQFSFGGCPVAVETTQIFVGTVDFKCRVFVMIKQPGTP